MTKAKKVDEATETATGMTLRKHPDQPIVEVVYHPRTYTDRRIAALRETPHAMSLVCDYANIRFVTVDGRTFLEGQTCPRCNQAEDTLAGHPAFRRVGGDYRPSGSTETANVCTLCGYRETPGEMFTRLYGDSEKHLDAAKIPRPTLADFVAVRFRKDKRALSRAFMKSIRSFEKLGEFSPATDFEAVAIRALTEHDAKAAFVDPTFDDSWWAVVEVDNQLRPLQRWNSLRWCADDESALNEGLQIRRNAMIRQIDLELQIERQRRLAELNL